MFKFSKKFFSYFMSFTISGIVSIPLIANALITYNDPSGDGNIAMNDNVLITQYLNGTADVTNLERLDFDNNKIISNADAFEIQLYKLGLINPGSINLPSSETYNGSSSAYYHVFSASTGSRLINRSYSLYNFNPVPNNITEPELTDVVIGNDSRVPNWDRTGVVKIMTPSYYAGSGFVIAPHVIATAAHCIYNYSNTSYESGIIISGIKLFNNAGVNTLTATPVECHVPYSYINSINSNLGQETNEYDYALITVEEDLSDYMCFDLGVALNAASVNHANITNAGFPEEINPERPSAQTVNTHYIHNMYQSTGNLLDSTSYVPDRQLFYDLDTSGGNSGGPIYFTQTVHDNNGNNTKVYYSVIAINVAGDSNMNIGTRINGELIRFFLKNNNLSW